MKVLMIALIMLVGGCSSVAVIDSDKGCLVTVNESIEITYVSESCQVSVSTPRP